jgi:hypothetical protein
MASGAAYTVESASSKVGTLSVGGELQLAGTARLVLTGATSTNGAKLAGTGKVVAGGTEIVPGTNGLQAVAVSGTPKVTISENSIASDGAVVTLSGVTGTAITVKAATLTVSAVTVDVTTAGTVTLKGSTDTPSNIGKLLLKGGTNAGSLVVDSTNSNAVTIGGGATATNFLLTASTKDNTTNATVTKADGTALEAATGIVVKAAADDASSGSNLGSIGGGSTPNTTDVLISGPSGAGVSDSAIAKGWKVEVPNS